MSSQTTPAMKEQAVAAVSSQDTDYISEDEQLHHLDKSGAINCVVGSQSMLSQEIGGLSQDSTGISEFNPRALLSQESTATKEESQEFLEFAKAARSKAAESSKTPKKSSESQASSKSADSQGSRPGADLDTLLTAVEIFTSQEQEETREDETSKLNILSQEAVKSNPILAENSGILQNHEGDQESQQCVFELLTSFQRNGKTCNQQSQSSSSATPATTAPKTTTSDSAPPPKKTIPKYVQRAGKRKRKNDMSEKSKQQMLAQRAAALAQRTIEDPDLAKRLLLSMALTRENPRSPPSVLPGKGAVVPEGFFWAHYPPLEAVLKDNMAEYYELSITKCQSAQQQGFNNKLVDLVRAETNRQQWVFDKCFTDKCLRDRIRCYYKTHIQNAKKRLRTMVKNPTKRANARHLCAHLDLIEKYGTSSAGRDQGINHDTKGAQKADDGWEYAAPAWSVPSHRAVPAAHHHDTRGSGQHGQGAYVAPSSTKRPRQVPGPSYSPNPPRYNYQQSRPMPPSTSRPRPQQNHLQQRSLPTTNRLLQGSSSNSVQQRHAAGTASEPASVPIGSN